MPDGNADDVLVGSRFVRADWTDLRDYVYQPSLSVLGRALFPDSERFFSIVRDQKSSARCTGHALANLIDLQRHGHDEDPGEIPADKMVSADMLYRMGAFHDDLPVLDAGRRDDAAQLTAHLTARSEGLRSLRSVLKGFYHHGVCLDSPPGIASAASDGRWQSDCFRPQPASPPQIFPTVAQAKAAREIGLGAFYRVQPVLNDYHAAINDTGGLLVSAQTHTGWLDPFEGGSEIGKFKLEGLTGSHAFVVVGYTDKGFLVFNSWGEQWGGEPWPAGVALWRYSDWAQTVMDGWVLRLGVSAPKAFELAIGEQGWRRTIGLIRGAAPRSHQLLGHYLHLDDGFHVERGTFPSDATTWSVTHKHLRRVVPGTGSAGDAAPATDARKGVLLWIPGSVEGLDAAARAAVRRKAQTREVGLYPYNFFWSHLFADKSIEVLTTVFDSCMERVGSEGPQLDALIEEELRGIGRAFWRDIEKSAQRAVRGPQELPHEYAPGVRRRRRAAHGPLLQPFRDMLRLACDTGCELHVVTEGAGVLVLHELLQAQAEARGKTVLDAADWITTLSLVHPAIDLLRADTHVVPLVARLAASDSAAGSEVPPRVRIYHASEALEARSSFGRYRGSILQLVARAFEDRHEIAGSPAYDAAGNRRPPMHPDNPPRVMLGMAAARGAPGVAGIIPQPDRVFRALDGVRDDRYATGRVPHGVLTEDPQIAEAIFETIKARRALPPPEAVPKRGKSSPPSPRRPR